MRKLIVSADILIPWALETCGLIAGWTVRGVAGPFDDGLNESYKRAVAESLGRPETPQFWNELETAVGTFLNLERHHVSRPPHEERAYWERIAKLANNLGAELRERRRQILWGQRPNVRRALETLWEIKDAADARVAGYDTIVKAFQRRDNPHRWYLYAKILDLWIELGGELRCSMSPKGVPYGPTIRFVQACANPLLAEPLTPNGISAFVDRHRKERSRPRPAHRVLTRQK
jgi:hypothetical protein